MTKRTQRSGTFYTTSIRHAVEVERYTANVVRRMLALMARTDEDLLQRIRDLDPESRMRGTLEGRLDALRKQQEEAAQLLKEALARETADFGDYEAAFTRSLGSVAASSSAGATATATVAIEWTGVTREQVRAAAMSRPFAGVHLKFAKLDEQLDEYGRRKGALVRDTIRRGFLEGRGTDDIVRELRGTRAQGYSDGLLTNTARGAEAIVRTAMNHTANAAREEVYKANANQIKGVQWVSVLDSRTTSICAALDGKVFRPDDGPRPPAHPNCRSTTVPIFKGDDPPEPTTYGDWLAKQDRGTIDDILGPSKAALFVDGGLKIDRFVNESGKTYTLTELQTREAAAWKAAGLGDIKG